jgi:hypothetical protein
MPATSYGLAIAAFFKGVGGFVQTLSLSPSYQALAHAGSGRSSTVFYGE